MLMPGRNFSTNSYRFGFNGKENDNEVYGITGSFQDYGMRMYNALTGRFISSDPIIIKDRKYPELSSYQFASNNPILMIDLDGKEGVVNDYNKMPEAEDYKKPLTANVGASQIAKGCVNIVCGTLGTVASCGYIYGSAGLGAALGGTLALDLSLSQISIGISQVIDASVNGDNPKMPKGDNIIGLIAYGLKSDYASLWNIAGALSPSVIQNGLSFLPTAWNSFANAPNLKNAIEAVDQTLQTIEFTVEVGKTIAGVDPSTVNNFSTSFSTTQIENKDAGTKTTTVTANYKYSTGEGKDKKEFSYSKSYTKTENIKTEKK